MSWVLQLFISATYSIQYMRDEDIENTLWFAILVYYVNESKLNKELERAVAREEYALYKLFQEVRDDVIHRKDKRKNNKIIRLIIKRILDDFSNIFVEGSDILLSNMFGGI